MPRADKMMELLEFLPFADVDVVGISQAYILPGRLSIKPPPVDDEESQYDYNSRIAHMPEHVREAIDRLIAGEEERQRS